MNPLSEIIRREIAQRGVLSFAHFMELALYCPKHGYYETKKDNPGRRGDFYTSVGVGEVFGGLLAFQFAGWFESLDPQSATLNLVEAGAHDGKLAADILGWLRRNRPELFRQVNFWLIEPSVQRQAWQKGTLKDFAPQVQWCNSLDDLKLGTQNSKSSGIIFSNELLDAMPVHRFGWDAAKNSWFEWGVAVDGEKFVWTKIQTPDARPLTLDPGLLAVLPDGYIVETGPQAEHWWRQAAGILDRGKLMAIDYGLATDELISPDRARGTLRAYYRHHASEDVLANVGEQDLTAHVNFSAVQAAGKSAGLKTECFETQSQFLTRILRNALKTGSIGKWTPAQARQFQTLTHPEHLGHAFRVLVQAK